MDGWVDGWMDDVWNQCCGRRPCQIVVCSLPVCSSGFVNYFLHMYFLCF